MSPGPKWRVAGVVAVAAVLGLTFIRWSARSTADAPRFELTEVFQSEGKQWAHFRVHPPSNSEAFVSYARLLGTHGTERGDSAEESNIRSPILLLSGQPKDITVQAPQLGAWRVRFRAEAPRKSILLGLDRLSLAWRRRTMDNWSDIPLTRSWSWESEPITNSGPNPAESRVH